MTALATRPDHRLPVEETSDSAMVSGYPTERQVHIAAAAQVRAAVPDWTAQVEILKALFADGDKLRKRAAEAQARAKTRSVSAPAKPPARKPSASPMVPIGPARERVADLIAQGMRQQAIAQAAGVSDAAVSMLVRGAYKKGDPPRQEITADLQRRILAVKFVAPKPRRRGKCRSAAEFTAVGNRVGQCLACGALASLYRGRLTAHVTRQDQGGAS